MRVALMAMGAMLVAGGAVIEQTPGDLDRELSGSTWGHLYERDPLQDR